MNWLIHNLWIINLVGIVACIGSFTFSWWLWRRMWRMPGFWQTPHVHQRIRIYKWMQVVLLVCAALNLFFLWFFWR